MEPSGRTRVSSELSKVDQGGPILRNAVELRSIGRLGAIYSEVLDEQLASLLGRPRPAHGDPAGGGQQVELILRVKLGPVGKEP